MTKAEWKAACRLSGCSFLPGSFDKKFVRQLPKWKDREMTEKGRKLLIALVQKYRRQIPGYEKIITSLGG
jgi:hypothetical protein